VPQDYAQAVKWYHKAAEEDHVPARNHLDRVINFFRDSANEKDKFGQYNLGLVYQNGIGVDQSDTEAFQWYQKAADQGYTPAQYRLGTMYVKGLGTRQNNKKAAKWLRTAADKGFTEAQYDLGLMYERGQGVAQDSIWAYTWLSLAATERVSNQNDLDRLKLSMSEKQISDAENRVSNWQVENK
jgi:hypothetical protein